MLNAHVTIHHCNIDVKMENLEKINESKLLVCLKEADSVGIIRDTNKGGFDSLESSVHAKQPLCIINGRDRLNREILWAWRAHFGHTLTKSVVIDAIEIDVDVMFLYLFHD